MERQIWKIFCCYIVECIVGCQCPVEEKEHFMIMASTKIFDPILKAGKMHCMHTKREGFHTTGSMVCVLLNMVHTSIVQFQ